MSAEKIIKKNIPIEGPKLIRNIEKLKLYENPTIKLTDIEESSSISLLVVGQTGSGKTTLLNAFINALIDIQITNDFRYKIIIEKFEHSEAFSMTDDVNIYNIKPIGNRPSIIIIDTPGFDDTRGIKQDKIIRDKIAHTFKKTDYNKCHLFCCSIFKRKVNCKSKIYFYKYIIFIREWCKRKLCCYVNIL